MTTEEKEILRSNIIEKIKNLEIELKMMEEIVKPISPDDAIGRVSRMDAINNQAVAKSAYGDKQTLLTRLNLSLKVIDKKEYGICVKCNSEIPFNRLKSIPYSNMCVNCASRF